METLGREERELPVRPHEAGSASRYPGHLTSTRKESLWSESDSHGGRRRPQGRDFVGQGALQMLKK